MKSFGTYTPPETVGLNFQRFKIPSGREFPRAPTQGEMFLLIADMPDNVIPWFSAGAYFHDGFTWLRIDRQRAKAAAAIGPQRHEVEAPVNVKVLPKCGTGLCLAIATLTPTSVRSGISGIASFTLEHEKDCTVLATVFRDKTQVGFSITQLEAAKSQHVTVSFFNYPHSTSAVTYSLEIAIGTAGFIEVNQTSTLTYDGHGQTAFIVEENS
jgi:hypothetical protein